MDFNVGTIITILGSLLQLAFAIIFLYMAFKAFTQKEMLLIFKLFTKKNYIKGLPLKVFGLAALNIAIMFVLVVLQTGLAAWNVDVILIAQNLLVSIGLEITMVLSVYIVAIVISIIIFLVIPRVFGYVDEEAEKKERGEDKESENEVKNKA